jgi:hypothetical protein
MGAANGVQRISLNLLAAIQMRTDTFHGEWNYTILPRS